MPSMISTTRVRVEDSVYPILTKRADLAFKASERAQGTLRSAETECDRIRKYHAAEQTEGSAEAHLDVLGVVKRAGQTLSKADAKFAALLAASDAEKEIAADVVLCERMAKLDGSFRAGNIDRKEWKKRQAALILARKAELSAAETNGKA